MKIAGENVFGEFAYVCGEEKTILGIQPGKKNNRDPETGTGSAYCDRGAAPVSLMAYSKKAARTLGLLFCGKESL